MSEQPTPAAGLPSILLRTRTQRIKTFILVLAALNLAFVVVGLLDLRSSPLTLALALIAYVYYGIYYLLHRAGYGVGATYGWVVLLLILIPAGVHNGGGFLAATVVLYPLLLVCAGMLLNEPRALDIIVTLCIFSYTALALYERLVTPPVALRSAYLTAGPVLIIAVNVSILVTLIGIWLVMRISIAGLHRSTAALELARAEAEERSRENSALVAQVQAGNDSLLAAQSRLRETVEALTLPLIPLDGQVALLPLIGYLDDARAERLVAGLLHGIRDMRARVVVLDVTGLREVDAEAAAALLRAADAARLLGASVVLSGISAATAQALVELNVGSNRFQTAGQLSDALRMAAAADRLS